MPQHNKDIILKGSGGGKAGAGQRAEEATNTLRSEVTINSLEVLSEGEIVGIINGWKGVTLNQIPVQNEDNSFNFEGIEGDFRVGTPSQTPISGFEEISSVFPSSTAVDFGNDVTNIVLGSDVTTITVGLSFPGGLSHLNLDSGGLEGYEVNYQILVQETAPSLGIPTIALDYTLRGKTTSSYEIDHRVQAPSGATSWQFIVKRLSPDDTATTDSSSFSVGRWTELQQPVPALTYDNTALAAIKIPARQVGNQIPARGYYVKGLIVDVPSNYDAETRTYSGTWDGTFIQSWTDNNSWLLYAVIKNERFGIGTFVGQAVKFNKWEFYDAGVYCDERIPDGMGGEEPRFSFNAVIQKRSSAWQLIQAMASSMRAVVVSNNDNEISLVQDRPVVPSKIITNSNVIDGLFTYSSTDLSARATSVNVTFNDKKDRFLPRTVSEPTSDDVAGNARIDKYGFTLQDLVAYGAVTESLARRMAKWVLYTNSFEFDNVNFGMGLNIVGLEVGDVIPIMDNDYITADNTTFLSGRILDVTGTTIVLDVPVDLSETNFTLALASEDYTGIIERTILNSGNTNTLTLDSALPAGNYEFNDFYCYKTGVIEPRLFKINSIIEASQGIFSVVGSFYDPQKWDYIEQGLELQPYNYSINRPIPAVTGLAVAEDNRNDDAIETSLIRIYWDYNPVHLRFEVGISYNGGGFVAHSTGELFLEFENIAVGSYEIVVTALGIGSGRSSTSSITYVYGGNGDLEPPINLSVVDGTNIFNDDRVSIGWEYNPVNADFPGALRDYQVDVFSADGLDYVKTYYIAYERDITAINYKGGAALYPKEVIVNDFGSPVRSFMVKVYSRDLAGRIGTSTDLIVSNPAPASPIGTTTFDNRDIIVTLDPASIIPDISNLILSVSLSSGFDHLDKENWLPKINAHRALQGNIYPNIQVGLLYIRYALDDTYSDLDLNWTAEYTIDVDGRRVYLTPGAPTNLDVITTNTESAEGVYLINLAITWDAVVDEVTGYTLSYHEVGSTDVLYLDTTEPSIYLENIVPTGTDYIIAVRANHGTSYSPYSADYLVSLDLDIIPPGAPSGLSFDVAPSVVGMQWTNPVDSDFKHTRVFVSQTNDRSTAALATTSAGTNHTFTSVTDGITYYFWLDSLDFSGNVSAQYPVDDLAGIPVTTSSDYTYGTPSTPTDLTLTELVSANPQTRAGINVKAEWTAPTEPVTSYTLEVNRLGSTDIATFQSSEPSYIFTDALGGITYEVRVRANYFTSSSPFTSLSSILVVGDIVPPGPPSNLTFTQGTRTATLSWDNPTDDDFKQVEIWVSAVDDQSTAILSTTQSGDSLFVDNLDPNETFYFWMRAQDRSDNYSTWYPATPLAGIAVTSGATLDITRYRIEAVDHGAIASGTFQPDFDNTTNIHRVTLTGNGVTILPPTATLQGQQVVEGYINVQGGSVFPPTFPTGNGEWDFGLAGLPTLTDSDMIGYFRLQSDNKTKAWVIGGFES